ncbi:MAG TPA: hypothetical protein VFV50_14020 [Bdellovibrionales bacterium]|nr:hypothetical protein [Bdellovibrionales bacterium]
MILQNSTKRILSVGALALALSSIGLTAARPALANTCATAAEPAAKAGSRVAWTNVYSRDGVIQRLYRSLEQAGLQAAEAVARRLELRLREQSQVQTRALLAAQREGRALVQDSVIIGGGVHGTIASLFLSPRRESFVVLEAGETPASPVWANAGATFPLNTKVEATNIPGSPVQMSNFSDRKHPLSSSLYSLIVASIAASRGPVLLENAVTRVQDRFDHSAEAKDWPARYRIETAQGLVFYTERPVLATGLQQGKYPVKSAKAIEQIEAERNRPLRSKEDMPTFMFFDEMTSHQRRLSRAGVPANLPVAGKTVAYIGAGASGNVAVENNRGQGPDGIYAGHPNPAGLAPAHSFWFGQKSKSYEEFKKNNPERYHETCKDIYERDDMTLLPSYVKDMERVEIGGALKWKLTYEDAGIVKDVLVDFVVATSGYNGTARGILGDLLAAAEARGQHVEFAPVYGVKPDTGEQIIVGRKLVRHAGAAESRATPPDQILVVGAGASHEGPLMVVNGVPQISIPNLGPRTVQALKWFFGE